jgi:hypothetical protein
MGGGGSCGIRKGRVRGGGLFNYRVNKPVNYRVNKPNCSPDLVYSTVRITSEYIKEYSRLLLYQLRKNK